MCGVDSRTAPRPPQAQCVRGDQCAGGGAFPKGCSGNPGGKPKNPKAIRDRQVIADVKELSRLEGPDAVRQLAAIMKDERAPHAARVSAANSLLDRGYGKPASVRDSG
jgi:hypothetical protein